MAACAQCGRQLETLRNLVGGLASIRHNQPTPAALVRYQQLFSHVQQQPSPLRQFVEQLRAQLTWDSRQQVALQGVRSAGAAVPAYRLLYESARTEVEMMVTPGAQRYEIDGEVIPMDAHDIIAPALVQLFSADLSAAYETESNEAGRFRFERILPGYYTMQITPPAGAAVALEDVEIA